MELVATRRPFLFPLLRKHLNSLYIVQRRCNYGAQAPNPFDKDYGEVTLQVQPMPHLGNTSSYKPVKYGHVRQM